MYSPALPLTGWIFDVYPTSGGMGVSRGQEFWPGESRHVLEFLLLDPERQPALLRQLAVPRPGITLYDCDVSPALTYCHARGIFPLAKVTVTTDRDSLRPGVASGPEGDRDRELRYEVEGSAWDLEYPEPPLTLMALTGQGDEQGRGAPLGRLRSLAVACEGFDTTIEEGDPETLLAELNRLIRRFDPHAIITDWGDAFL